MGERRVRPYLNTGETIDFVWSKAPTCGEVLDEPKVFTHNEPYMDYFAWVCRHCRIVRLENDEGPGRWFCDVCRVHNRLSTGPLNGDKE